MSNREVKTQSGFSQKTGDIGHGNCLPAITLTDHDNNITNEQYIKIYLFQLQIYESLY
jgi:hypothetical protein